MCVSPPKYDGLYTCSIRRLSVLMSISETVQNLKSGRQRSNLKNSCDIDARETLVSHRERILKEQGRDRDKSHQTAALKALFTKYENKITTLTEVKLLRLSAMDYGNYPQVTCAHKTEKLRPDAITEFSKITSCQAHILAPKCSDNFT